MAYMYGDTPRHTMLDSLYIWYLKTFLPGWTYCHIDTDTDDYDYMTNPCHTGQIPMGLDDELTQLIDDHYDS